MAPHARRTAVAAALTLVSASMTLSVSADPVRAATRGASPAAARIIVDPTDRAAMKQSYLDVLRPALRTPIGWQGNLKECRAGHPSAAAQKATLRTVNWFRAVEGLGPVKFTDTLSAKAQKAALIMARNGALSHSPPESWKCRTAAGAAAAGHSNLYLGRAGAAAVVGYMDDPGSGNTAAGHRRWIIDPRQTKMGSGSVQGRTGEWQKVSNALYVLHTSSFQAVPESTPEFLPWPAAGYIPIQVEPEGRWSLSAKDRSTDFSNAVVSVDGSSAGVTQRDVVDGYGPPTLVWDFDPDFDPGDDDRDYDVTVSGISQGTDTVSYSYTVTLFDAES